MGEGVEIGGGRAVRDADDGEDFAVGLKVLPRAGRGSGEDELKAEGGGGGIPGLVGEGGLLMLGVEGADGGEGDGVVAEEEGGVMAEEVWGDRSDGEDCYSDHAASLNAHVRLHYDIQNFFFFFFPLLGCWNAVRR